MISEERVKDLWLYRDNIHDGDLVAQLCDLARKIEVEVATPLLDRISYLEKALKESNERSIRLIDEKISLLEEDNRKDKKCLQKINSKES